VEQGGHDGVGVQVEVGQEDGGLQGMDDVGLARLAGLALVALMGVGVGLLNAGRLIRRQVETYPVQEGLNFRGSYPISASPWEHRYIVLMISSGQGRCPVWQYVVTVQT
jgi:hypothetical protein